MRDRWIGLDPCTDVLDVLHQHEFTHGGDEHADRAFFLIGDLARTLAEMCTGCPDQSCPACRTRLRYAQAYGQMADHMFQVAEVAPAARQAEPARPVRHPRLTSGKEAGQ